MNILITGANGQLGNEMRIVSKTSTDKYIFTDVCEQEGNETTFLDITDLDAIRKIVKENNVNAIVNCAAYTNVDAAENAEELAEKLIPQAENYASQYGAKITIVKGKYQMSDEKGHPINISLPIIKK